MLFVRLFYRLIILVVIFLAISATIAGYKVFSRHITELTGLLLIGGFIIGLLFDRLFLRRYPFWATLEHEITHALAGLPFGILPYKIVATNGRGGNCRSISFTPALIAPVASDFVTLAPYVVPTLTLFLVFGRSLVPHQWILCFDILIGISLGYHTSSTIAEIRNNWKSDLMVSFGDTVGVTDIGKTGQWFAALYIPLMTLVIHGLCLAQYAGGLSGSRKWCGMLVNGVSANWVSVYGRFVGLVS